MSRLDNMADWMRPSRNANILLWSIAAFVLIAILWASLARIDTVTRGQGRVIPSTQLQRVAHLEGGILRHIGVREGASVKAGDILLELDPVENIAELARGTASEQALAARLMRLEAETGRGRLAMLATLPTAAEDQVSAERALYRARQLEMDAALAVAGARMSGAERTLAEAEAMLAARSEALAFAQRDLAMIAPLVEKGIEPRSEQLRAESALIQARANEAAAVAARGRASAAVTEARSEVRSVRERFRSAASEAEAQTRAEMKGITAAIPALRDRLHRSTVRAPVAGTINRVLVNTVGGVVRAGEPLVEIVPSDDTLVIETRISPRDIGFIHPRQAAAIKLTAYDSAVYGSLKGWVEAIGADAVIDEQARESYYLVRIRTRDTLRDAQGKALPIVPGMIADVDIIGAPRTVMSYLLTPFERVRESAFRER